MVLLVLVFLVILGLPRDMLQRVMLPSGIVVLVVLSFDRLLYSSVVLLRQVGKGLS